MLFVTLTSLLALLPVTLGASVYPPGSPFSDIANVSYCSPIANGVSPNLVPPFNLTVYEGQYNASELVNTTLTPIRRPAINANSDVQVVSWVIDIPAGTNFSILFEDSASPPNRSTTFHALVVKTKSACNQSLLTLPYDAASVEISASPARLSLSLSASVVAFGLGSVAMLLF